VGVDLSLYDETGLSYQIASGIKVWLLKNPDVEVRNMAAASDLDRRDAAILAQNDELGAIDLLAQKIQAELIFYAKISVAPAGTDAKYKLSCTLINARRGTEIASEAFDWKLPLTGENVRVVTGALTAAFLESYINWVTDRKAPAYDLVLTGFDNEDQVEKLRDTVSSMSGVAGRVTFRTSGNLEARVVSLKVPFDGTADDLYFSMRKRIRDKAQLDISSFDLQGGRMLLKVSSQQEEVAPALINDMVAKTPDGAAFKNFEQAYNNKDRPKIAVIINWLLRPEQSRQGGVDVNKLKLGDTDAPTAVRNEIGGNVIGLQTMESSVLKSLGAARVGIVDAIAARAAIRDRIKLPTGSSTIDAATLEEEIRKQAVPWDIMIWGLADVNEATHNDGGTMNKVTNIIYDFRMTDARTGEFLGSQRWPDANHLKLKGKSKVDPNDADSVSRYVVGSLLDQLCANRLFTATELRVVINGVSDTRIVSTLADSLKTNISPEILTTSSIACRDGIGSFIVRYQGNYQDFLKKLESELQRQPFEMNASESSATALVLRTRNARASN
jgi:hypothetical protein